MAFTHRDRLIEDRQAIAHRPFGRTRDQCQRIVIGFGVFILGNFLEMRGENRLLDAAQIEPLAA